MLAITQKRCIECHGADTQEGDVRFDKLTGSPKEEPVWASILEQLEKDAMPPKDELRLSREEHAALTAWIERSFPKAAQALAQKMKRPENGNLVPHDKLFDPKTAEQGPKIAASPARVWRALPVSYVDKQQAWLKAHAAVSIRRERSDNTLPPPFGLHAEHELKNYSFRYTLEGTQTAGLANNARLLLIRVMDGDPKNEKSLIRKLALAKGPPSAEDVDKVITDLYRFWIGRLPDDEELAAKRSVVLDRIKKLGNRDGLIQGLVPIMIHPEVFFHTELGSPTSTGNPAFLSPQELVDAVDRAILDRRSGDPKRSPANWQIGYGQPTMRDFFVVAAEAGKLNSREDVLAVLEEAATHKKMLPLSQSETVRRFLEEYFNYTHYSSVFKCLNDLQREKDAGRLFGAFEKSFNDGYGDNIGLNSRRVIDAILAEDKQVLARLLTTQTDYRGDSEVVIQKLFEDKRRQLESGIQNLEKRLSQQGEKQLSEKDRTNILKDVERRKKALTELIQRHPDRLEPFRVGLLNQRSWLVSHSTNVENHPIHRGKWIRERLLGGRVPDEHPDRQSSDQRAVLQPVARGRCTARRVQRGRRWSGALWAVEGVAGMSWKTQRFSLARRASEGRNGYVLSCAPNYFPRWRVGLVWVVFFPLVALLPVSGAYADETSTESKFVRSFLDAHCAGCHGEKKPEAELALQDLSITPQSAADLATWRRVFEQITDEAMPPEDEKQPSRAEREKILAWLEDTLEANSSLNLAPSQANYVDHEALFSGKPVGDPATPARVWRLPGKNYEAFMHSLRIELGLPHQGFEHIRAPWGGDGYSTAGRIDEAELESHMRTCAFVLSRIMPRVEKNTFAIRSLHPVYQAGKDATAEQIQAAVKESFAKILRLTPEPSEMQEYSKLLMDDLKTYEPLRAVERFLTRVLFHPVVLYRVETPIAGSQRSIMPPRQLARAIAYSLTYSEPDEGLRKAVAEGRLSTREDVRREVERLVYATTPYGQEVSLTADQLAKLDALNREHWKIKTPEAREAANYNQKLKEVLGEQAARWIQLQKTGYRSMDGEYANLTALLRPRVMSFFQEYFVYRKSPFKCNVTLKELNVIESGNGGWSSHWFGNDTDRLVGWVLESDKEVLRTLLTTRKTFVVARRNGHAEQGFRRHTGQIGEMQKWKHFQDALQTYEVSLTPEQWLLGKEEPVDMPKGHRMGILTHPSWLVAQSGNFDNDAIHRGKWIHEKLLGGRIPDVPITVDAKLPDEPHNTLRERMRVTRQDYCIKCHNRMDALGLTFEQFDHFGRNRSAEIVVDQEKTAKMTKRSPDTPRIMTTKPFETTGHVYYSGDPKLDGPVKDAFELIEKLAHSERVEQVFVRHVFRYFMGRNETLADGPTLVAAHKAYRENGGSFNALLVSLLTSDSFLYRTLPTDPQRNKSEP